MNITLTKKEILYCISDKVNELKLDKFGFVRQLADVLEGKVDDENVSIAVDADILFRVFEAVSRYPHGMAKNINPSISTKLLSQIVPLANDDEDAAKFIAQVTEYNQKSEVAINVKIASAKEALSI